MSWLPKWIRHKTHQHETPSRFGRQFMQFTTPEKVSYWEDSLIKFEEGKYLEAIEAFLQYLKYDASENVDWNRKGDHIKFSICQGSKVIYGEADEKKVQVGSPVAMVKNPSIGLLRKLLELNYKLKFSRYSLDDSSRICLRFDSFAIDGSPYKLFTALKEVALNADKEDDLILEDFPGLEPVNTGHIKEIEEREKQVKLDLFKRKVLECLALVKDPKLNSTLHTNSLAYIILDTIYRLDYLTRPEGKTMFTFEEIQKTFFSGNAERTTEKLREAIMHLERLSKRSDEDFLKELYVVPRTFSVLESSTAEVIKGMWDSEFQHIDWYIESKSYGIAKAIVGYVLGYSIFNYSMKPVYLDLIHLYYVIEEIDFFSALGFNYRFINARNEIAPGRFKSNVKEILERYDKPVSHVDILDFSNEAVLSRSFLKMLSNLMENE